MLFVNDLIKENEKFIFQIDSTSTCNTKLLEKDRKNNKQSKSVSFNHHLEKRN